MAFLRILLIVLASVLGLSNSAYVDTLRKCKLDDSDCQKSLIEDILKDIAKTGIPELEMPPIDPVPLHNVKVSIPDVLEITLIDGVAKGVSRCKVDKFFTNFDTLHASIELKCNITVKGTYKLQSSAPIIKSLFGNDVHGEGNGKVKIVNMYIYIDFPYEIQKRGSNTFLTSDRKKYKYSHEVQDKVVFGADNLYLGEKESSNDLVALANSNWKPIVDNFGKPIFDVGMEIVFEFLQKFFNNVPTDKYLVGDITQYA